MIRNIRLSRNTQINFNNKLVYVKVLEFDKNKSEVIISLNGIKTKAKTTTELPQNFLAIVNSNESSIELKIIYSLKDNALIKTMENELLNKIETFLLKNNLPIDKNYIMSSLILLSNGLGLNKKHLKQTKDILIKYGETFAKTFVNAIKKGINTDNDSNDLIYNYHSIMKILYDNKKENNNRNNDELIFAYYELLKKITDTDIIIKPNQNNDEPFIIARKKNASTFIFDISSEITGPLFVEIEYVNSKYNISVYTDNEVLEEQEINKKIFDEFKRKMSDNLNVISLNWKLHKGKFMLFEGETENGYYALDLYV